MTDMPSVLKYPEIDADILKAKGVIDIIRTPIDGVNSHPRIPWDRVSNLALTAMYIKRPEEPIPSAHYHLRVHFEDDLPRPIDFALRQETGETFAISTVSGTQSGQRVLSSETSSIIARLLFQSLNS
jgi:hypothetical protein